MRRDPMTLSAKLMSLLGHAGSAMLGNHLDVAGLPKPPDEPAPKGDRPYRSPRSARKAARRAKHRASVKAQQEAERNGEQWRPLKYENAAVRRRRAEQQGDQA